MLEDEKTCHSDIPSSDKMIETSHSLVQESKPETSPSSNESELIEAQDISSIKVPKENENRSVDSTDIPFTESQFSSTMPYCEESLVAKLDPIGTSQFLSAQPCHKEDTTSALESVDTAKEEETSISDTEDCTSGTFDSKIPADDTHVKIDSVSDLKVDKSHTDHGKMQPIEKTIVKNEVPSEPIVSPPQVRRSTRANKGIPTKRYGSATSHRVNATKKFGSISKKIDILYDHVFD